MSDFLHALNCSKCGASLPAQEGQRVLACGYCGQSHAFLPPPKPAPARARFAPGQKVAVERGGHWWPAVVLHEEDPEHWHIHYDYWSGNHDEVVDRSRIRHAGPSSGRPQGALLGALAGGLLLLGLASSLSVWLFVRNGSTPATTSSAAAPATAPAATRTQPSTGTATGSSAPSEGKEGYTKGARYLAGEEVWVWWGSKWWDGKIEKVNGSEYLISYDGWSSSWNETVTLQRLRKK